jgi:hypothetical protein
MQVELSRDAAPVRVTHDSLSLVLAILILPL